MRPYFVSSRLVGVLMPWSAHIQTAPPAPAGWLVSARHLSASPPKWVYSVVMTGRVLVAARESYSAAVQ